MSRLLSCLFAICACALGACGGNPTTDTGPAAAAPEAIPVPPAIPPGADANATHFSLSLLHFNIQYVAGGLVGYAAAVGVPQAADIELDAAGVEDQIIAESFVPILALLERRHEFALTIELQGYMLDVLRERHPDVLDRLRALCAAGQIELVSIHWSDELFVAYPEADLARAIADTERSARAARVPLSTVVFAQEGQFSQAMLRAGTAAGRRIFLLPTNALHVQIPDAPVAAAYTASEIDGAPTVVVVGGGVDLDPIQMHWSFFNDGELLATDRASPYFGKLFVHSDTALANYEASLDADRAAGESVTTVSHYVARLQALGTALPTLPPVLDGTWQPKDTGNLALWMGSTGAYPQGEDDLGVLTAVRRARSHVLAAEAAGGTTDAAVQDAWRELQLAKVSDATGWNPWLGEVSYGKTHAAAADAKAAQLVAAPADALPPCGDAMDAPLTVTASAAAGDPQIRWSAAGDAIACVEIAFAAGDPDAHGDRQVVFPWDAVAVRAAGRETPLDALSGVVAKPGFAVALPDGAFGLDPEHTLVLDLDVVQLAARMDAGAHTVTFRDEAFAATTATWQFYVASPDVASAMAAKQ